MNQVIRIHTFPPGFGLRDVPRTAREQLCAQVSLGLLNDAAQAGLRHPQIRRSRAEAAEPRKRHEGAKMLHRKIWNVLQDHHALGRQIDAKSA